MPGFTGDGVLAHLAACASRDEIRPGPIMEHGSVCICVSLVSVLHVQMQRLPGLPSSNLMSDVLTGRLDSIGFEDILNG